MNLAPFVCPPFSIASCHGRWLLTNAPISSCSDAQALWPPTPHSRPPVEDNARCLMDHHKSLRGSNLIAMLLIRELIPATSLFPLICLPFWQLCLFQGHQWLQGIVGIVPNWSVNFYKIHLWFFCDYKGNIVLWKHEKNIKKTYR